MILKELLTLHESDKHHDARVEFVQGWSEENLSDYSHIEEAEEDFWEAVQNDPERKAEAESIGLTLDIASDILDQEADRLGLNDHEDEDEDEDED